MWLFGTGFRAVQQTGSPKGHRNLVTLSTWPQQWGAPPGKEIISGSEMWPSTSRQRDFKQAWVLISFPVDIRGILHVKWSDIGIRQETLYLQSTLQPNYQSLLAGFTWSSTDTWKIVVYVWTSHLRLYLYIQEREKPEENSSCIYLG